jgi:hypothetical protein
MHCRPFIGLLRIACLFPPMTEACPSTSLVASAKISCKSFMTRENIEDVAFQVGESVYTHVFSVCQIMQIGVSFP